MTVKPFALYRVTENHSGDDVAEADVDKRPYDVSVVEFVGQRDVAARINADNAPHAIVGTEEAAHRHRRPRIILDGTDYHAFCGCADWTDLRDPDRDCPKVPDSQYIHPTERFGLQNIPVFRLGYGKLCSSNPHIHVAELFGEEPELLTRTVVPSVDPDVRAVFACLRVLDVEHESVFVCDCPIGFHPRAGKPYRLRRMTADQEYRRANRVDLVYGKLCDPDNEPLPCPLQTLQHGQIGAEIVAGGCLDVAVTELSCDH